jgi:hypothetical protein
MSISFRSIAASRAGEAQAAARQRAAMARSPGLSKTQKNPLQPLSWP